MELLSVAVITALVEGVKQTTGLPSRFSFALSLAFGLAAAIIVAVADTQFSATTIVEGLLLGLGASGFYSGAVKNRIN